MHLFSVLSSNTDMKTDKYSAHIDRDDLSSCSQRKESDSSNDLIQKPTDKGSRRSSKTSAKEGERSGKESGRSSRRGSVGGAEAPRAKREHECACPMIEVEIRKAVPAIKEEEMPREASREKIGMKIITTETVTQRQYTYDLDVDLPEGMRVSPRGKLVQDQGASAENFGPPARPLQAENFGPLSVTYQRPLPAYQEPYVASEQPPLVYAPGYQMPMEMYSPTPVKSVESIVFNCVCNTGAQSTTATSTTTSTKSSKADSKDATPRKTSSSTTKTKSTNGTNGTDGQEQKPGLVQVEVDCRYCKRRKVYLVCKACNSKNKIRVCKDCKSRTEPPREYVVVLGRAAGGVAEQAQYQGEYGVNDQLFAPQYGAQSGYGPPQYAPQPYAQTGFYPGCTNAPLMGGAIVLDIKVRESRSKEKREIEDINNNKTSTTKTTSSKERKHGAPTSGKSARGSSLCGCGHDKKTCKVCAAESK
ncbi:unnamed protein product [Ixodes hexagonus]